MTSLSASINRALITQPKPPKLILDYGTAGFRTHIQDLRHAMVRCSILAVLRSNSQNFGPVGICVTASHNPEEYNGVKIIEGGGAMLCNEFEEFATELVNSDTPFGVLERICLCRLKFDLSRASEDVFKRCKVFLGYDSRISSIEFAKLIESAVKATGATCINLGLSTTPIVHWSIAQYHDCNCRVPCSIDYKNAYIQHVNKVTSDFTSLFSGTLSTVESNVIFVDGACGIGGMYAELLKGAFASLNYNIIICNNFENYDASKVKLNVGCGAEMVQKTKLLSSTILQNERTGSGNIGFALDGDADRVVFFEIPQSGTDLSGLIVDGDRIAAYIAEVIMDLLKDVPSNSNISFGVVQTAYANGASTQYLQSMNVPNNVRYSVVFTKTGVKYIHKKASEFDVGVYFEANGHGSVIFSETALRKWAAESVESKPFQLLLSFLNLFNPSVGDALMDAIAFVAALRLRKNNLRSILGMYDDMPSFQEKLTMSQENLRKLLPDTEHERRLIQPVLLQAKIDKILSECDPKGALRARAFIRPSGTESVVRLYVEATDTSVAKHVVDRLVECINTWDKETACNCY